MASIQLENISVNFPVFSSNTRSLKRKIVQMGSGGFISRDSSARIIVEALRGVSLQIGNGDRVGLCGHNGSGKTTLLRVMAGIYEPVREAMTKFLKEKVCSEVPYQCESHRNLPG